MNTEYADKNVSVAGWLFYDGECPLCCASARRVEPILARHHFQLRTLQSPEAPLRLGLSGRALLRETRLLLPDGRRLDGADALLEIARHIAWAWPLWFVSHIPGARHLLRAAYRVVAANRHCSSGACRLPRRHAWRDGLPLLLLPAAAIASQDRLPAWAFMWLLSFALFFGCKWFTLQRAKTRPIRGAALAYLLAWPGMDADAFLGAAASERPQRRCWLIAGAETTVGAVLLGLAARSSLDLGPLLTGWLGMTGIVMMLHFGLFQLLSLGWRAAGRDATPLMRAPLLATSLAEFWSSRWNTAFSALAHDLIFRKLARPLGIGWATSATFLVSGLVHDLVISLPARGGYGLPTAYFLVQGAGVLIERSRAGRALGLGGGWRGWLFTITLAAAPALGLFHPPFVRNVILPMLQTLGADPTIP